MVTATQPPEPANGYNLRHNRYTHLCVYTTTPTLRHTSRQLGVHYAMSLSVTRTASVKHRSAKGFRPQRAYDYLYGTCVVIPSPSPVLCAPHALTPSDHPLLLTLSLLTLSPLRPGAHGVRGGGPRPVQLQGLRVCGPPGTFLQTTAESIRFREAQLRISGASDLLRQTSSYANSLSATERTKRFLGEVVMNCSLMLLTQSETWS
jgi:hypothetical protein